ncbi:SDR family NAD(P)-dependent oxidoreductase [Marinobacterium mangrovicola]|uniref:NAD(P)-dependent dehydrogenase (Short-subunit alcohol dehydrogenase family) n=1 Tax=Marinobacterium mangrovicola TaxID=1476959 RepID=A0A4R1GIT4_9GAMM|nr:SDR family oxidoreductase [Marinobacterium mangrovicola]TCK08227.1 NAD(P)-dependent dehydrogenase (short-subunit alcohol dehydrogenase family) [Marinobacterium mangrovicola]
MNSKIALITGGNRGLGKSMILHLAAQGCDALFTYRSHREEAEAVIKEVEALGAKAVALPLDMAQKESFPAFAAEVQTLLAETWQRQQFDFLVNNAGIGLNSPISETSEAQFDQLMAIHLKGPFFLTQQLLPLIADGGRILNLSSGLTRFATPGYAAYAMMKGGIEVFSHYLAKELGPRRISVNTLAPGAVATDFRDGAIRDSKEMSEFVAAQTALGRVGQPEDIGGVVAALLSPQSGWINAQRIEASGGMFL